jgi:hypothetical protein
VQSPDVERFYSDLCVCEDFLSGLSHWRVTTLFSLQHLNASFRNSVLEQCLISDMMWLQAVLGEYRSRLNYV